MFAKCFKNYCNFTGRARRKEYWIYTIIAYIINIVLLGCLYPILLMISNAGMISNEVTRDQLNSYLISSPCLCLFFLIYLAMIIIDIPSVAVSVRRLHDIGYNAWWLLIYCIPVIGYIWFFILMLLPGQSQPNQWGPNPKLLQPNEINQIGQCGYYYNKAIKNYFKFCGKSSIEEFFGFSWMLYIITFIIFAVALIIGGIANDFHAQQSQNWMITSVITLLLMILYYIFLIIPAITITLRRLRDANYSPWFILLTLVGNIGSLAVYILCCQPKKIPIQE